MAGLRGDNYADPTMYRLEAADARTKAIAEYRAGLALDDQIGALQDCQTSLGISRSGGSST